MMGIWKLGKIKNVLHSLIKVSKETNISVIKLVHILHFKNPRIKLTDALKISKALGIPLSQPVDIQFDIRRLYHI